jgi:acyl-coenzyme A synthetase/AMP-(fatty) acid ligase
MQDVPLLAAAAADVTVAWRAGRAVSAAQYAADVRRLAARLPVGGHVLNACGDRYLFAVALGAALLREQVTLLPPDHTAQTVLRLVEFAPEVRALVDESTAALDLPRVAVPTESAPTDAAFDVPEVPAGRLCAIVFTSGSTGNPVPNLKHWGGLARNVRGALERWGFAGARPAIVATVPPQHMYGFESTVLAALFGGGALCAERPFYPQDVCAALERVPRPRVLVTTPFHLRALLGDTPRPPPADLVLCATAPLDDELAERAEAGLGAPLLEIYGCTETGQMATRRTSRGPEWRTLPGVRVVLRGDRAWASGGHIEQPTALGDVLEPLAGDRFLLGSRLSDTVNVAGKRSSLAHLEAQLRGVEGVADCVFYMPGDSQAGGVTRIAAFVVAPGQTRAALLAALRQRIDPAFLPRPLVLLDRLPRAPSGKLPRDVLLALARAHGAEDPA